MNVWENFMSMILYHKKPGESVASLFKRIGERTGKTQILTVPIEEVRKAGLDVIFMEEYDGEKWVTVLVNSDAEKVKAHFGRV